jgi:hypothetical protein
MPEGDVYEFELERAVRAIVRARASKRVAAFWAEVEDQLGEPGFQVKSGVPQVPIGFPPVLPDELWRAYAERTHGEYGEWFVSRMLADVRIQKILTKAGSTHSVVSEQAVALLPRDNVVGGDTYMSTASLEELSDEELRRRWIDEEAEDAGHVFIAIYTRYRRAVRDELEAGGLNTLDADERVGSVFLHAHERALVQDQPLGEVLLMVAREVAQDTSWSPPPWGAADPGGGGEHASDACAWIASESNRENRPRPRRLPEA